MTDKTAARIRFAIVAPFFILAGVTAVIFGVGIYVRATQVAVDFFAK